MNYCLCNSHVFDVSSFIGEGVKLWSFANTVPKSTATNMLSDLTKVASVRTIYPNLFFINVILCPKRCLKSCGAPAVRDTLETETPLKNVAKFISSWIATAASLELGTKMIVSNRTHINQQH